MNRNRLQGAIQDVAGKVEQTFGMATGDAGRRGSGVVREAGGKGRYFYGRAQDGVDDAAEAARGFADTVTGRATDAYGRIGRNFRGGVEPLRHQVERFPLATLFAVGLAGYALGLLSNSVRR